MRSKTIRVSAIVPAYNEQNTILPVLRILEHHPLIDELIVVNDASTDQTVKRARKSSAIVIDLKKNVGKGKAMSIAVDHARGDVLLFCDADLTGLTEEMVTLMIEKVTSGEFEMFTLMRDENREVIQRYMWPYFNLGGERVLTRRLWNLVPAEERVGYNIETALNYYAYKHGLKDGFELALGLQQTYKQVKWGFIVGTYHHTIEMAEWMSAVIRLFVFGYERGKVVA